MANHKHDVCFGDDRGGDPPNVPNPRYRWALLAVIAVLAPLGLGAKGCDIAIVGDDCSLNPTDPKCADAGIPDGGLSRFCNRESPCAAGQYCDYPTTAQCGASETSGTCRKTPTACTTEYKPVCGCDGQTYPNSCTAASAGVSVRAEGECGSVTPSACGGSSGQKCGDGQFCDFPIETKCGTSGERPGSCVAIPTACDALYAPVCGCDGKTYENACAAAAAGVSLERDAACPVPPAPCNEKKGILCQKGEYCEYATQDCNTSGRDGSCVALPTACDNIYDPVCGCDGKTYGNWCEAAAAGVSIWDKRACEATSDACGGSSGRACEKGEFCNYVEGKCGAGDQGGTCATIPTGCRPVLDPVCGCDRKTYDSPCMAAVAGMSIAYKGRCAEAIACNKGKPCADGQFCQYSTGMCGSEQDGTCAAIPTACTDQYQPVCGCDGKTYGNDCMASAAGVSVRDKQACPVQAKACGGIQGIACAKGEFCDFPIETQCGSGDQMGTCTKVPTACTKEYKPVCGCSGQSYPNLCALKSASDSVAPDQSSCAPKTQSCGGKSGVTCGVGQYCAFPPDDPCGASGNSGVCTAGPDACDTIYDPACACNGQTYSSACVAMMSGQSTLHGGACP